MGRLAYATPLKGGLAKRAAARYQEVYGDLDDSDDDPPHNVYLAMTAAGLYTSTPVVSCTYTYIHIYMHMYIHTYISLYYIYICVHIIMCVGCMNSQ